MTVAAAVPRKKRMPVQDRRGARTHPRIAIVGEEDHAQDVKEALGSLRLRVDRYLGAQGIWAPRKPSIPASRKLPR
jgi:hypothetical protein